MNLSRLIGICLLVSVIGASNLLSQTDTLTQLKAEVEKTQKTESTQQRESDGETKAKVSGGNEMPFRVIDVHLASDSLIKEAGLNDEIIVKLDTLLPMLNRATEKTGSRIILFIENLPLKGLHGLPDIKNNEIRFRLSRTEQAKENWNDILSRPSFREGSKQVLISVGFENDKAIQTLSKEKNFTLVIVKAHYFWICLLIIATLLILLIWLARNSEMLKEPFSGDENGQKRPYSLALTQMAFWYFLVVSAIIMLFLITKEFPDINASVLVLIGISSLTALGSVSINYTKINDTKNKLIALEAEKKTLSDRLMSIDTTLALGLKLEPAQYLELQKEKLARETRLNEVIETIPKYQPTSQVYFSKGFLRDLVSDPTGVSLHRFQIAVWTLILGFDFFYSVWSELKMPEFNETLLTLMGISSGTYIGFKIPEQKS